MYAAWRRGDISALLDRLDEEIVWIVPGASGQCRGVAQVREWFEELGRRLTFTAFEARDFIAQGNRVVVLVHYEGRNNQTGRNFEAESAMLWTIGNGRVVRFREYTDTEALAAAARAAE